MPGLISDSPLVRELISIGDAAIVGVEVASASSSDRHWRPAVTPVIRSQQASREYLRRSTE